MHIHTLTAPASIHFFRSLLQSLSMRIVGEAGRSALAFTILHGVSSLIQIAR